LFFINYNLIDTFPKTISPNGNCRFLNYPLNIYLNN